MESPQGVITVDSSHIYSGELLGESKSHVFGSIIDGVFEGKIITNRDSYFVENAKHYFPNETHLDHGFHSIIYNEDHVDDPYSKHRHGKWNFIMFVHLTVVWKILHQYRFGALLSKIWEILFH